MAGDWIKMREDLHEDPAVLKIAYRLKSRPEHVVGYCHRFWGWVSRNVSTHCPQTSGTESGHMSRSCPQEIGTESGQMSQTCPTASPDPVLVGIPIESIEGVLNLPGFLSLLVDVGWLIYDPESKEHGGEPVISIPKFGRHLSEGAKARGLAAEKKRLQRDAASNSCPDSTGTNVPKLSRKNGDKCPAKTGTREEKRRVNKKKEEMRRVASDGRESFDPLLAELPFKSNEFRAVWTDWCTHRNEIRKKLTEKSVNTQLGMLAEIGESRAVAMVRHTIAMGWQGLREADQPRGGSQSATTPTSGSSNGTNADDVPVIRLQLPDGRLTVLQDARGFPIKDDRLPHGGVVMADEDRNPIWTDQDGNPNYRHTKC